MKKRIIIILISCLSIGFTSSCTYQDAAMMGTIISRPVGYPLGVAAVAVEEAFATAGDIKSASPRNNKTNYNNRNNPASICVDGCVSKNSRAVASSDSKYYETKLVIKSKGPMHIEDVYFKDSSDVTDFWE